MRVFSGGRNAPKVPASAGPLMTQPGHRIGCQVHDLQDAIKASQKGEGKVGLPNWDQAARKDIHDALLVLAKYSGGFARLRRQRSGRPRQASDRYVGGLGWQGCDLSQLLAIEK